MMYFFFLCILFHRDQNHKKFQKIFRKDILAYCRDLSLDIARYQIHLFSVDCLLCYFFSLSSLTNFEAKAKFLFLLLRIMAAAAGQAVLVLGKKNACSAARAELSPRNIASAYLVFFPDLYALVLLLASRLFSFARHDYHFIF